MVTFLSLQVHLLSFFYSVQFTVLDVGTTHVDKPWFEPWKPHCFMKKVDRWTSNANYSVKDAVYSPGMWSTLLGKQRRHNGGGTSLGDHELARWVRGWGWTGEGHFRQKEQQAKGTEAWKCLLVRRPLITLWQLTSEGQLALQGQMVAHGQGYQRHVSSFSRLVS